MKVVSLYKKPKKKTLLLTSLFLLAANLFFSTLEAQSNDWLIDSSIHLIDGLGAPYSNVQAGDTIYLKAGNRDKLLIRNFKGLPDKPITFMNKDGVVNFSTNSYYGISLVNCQYTRLSGQGNSSEFYGIQIKRVLNGSGIGIGVMSSDFEIDHVLIEDCKHSGIFAKTDPDCSLAATRDSFTQFNTNIHDNYILNVGNEGMYIGSSFYSGYHITCNGKDTTVFPPVLNNVRIYNNIVQHSGWDGIQVSSAPLHCRIYNNSILNDSQAEVPNQMSGILIGGGSRCDCYNNLVSDGKGDGIEDHGLGGNRIYNNIIVNAGLTYLPGDLTQMKHGIFVSDATAQKDSAFFIAFNDIIHPKSNGIRFQSIKSRHNLIASNLIVNPGNYHLYETDNTAFSGKDAYVMIPDAATDLQLKNNYFSGTIKEAGISANDYTVLPGSPLINHGFITGNPVSFDYRNHRRPAGGIYDIGAMEYDAGNDTLLHTSVAKTLLFPNPVHSKLTVRFLPGDYTITILSIYNIKGALVLQQNKSNLPTGMQDLQINVDKLSNGLYIYRMENGNEITYGKFVKF